MTALIATICFVAGTIINLFGKHLLGVMFLILGWICYLIFVMDNR